MSNNTPNEYTMKQDTNSVNSVNSVNYLSPFYQTYPANGFHALHGAADPGRGNEGTGSASNTAAAAAAATPQIPLTLPHSIQQQPSFATFSRRSSHESEISNTPSSRKSSFTGPLESITSGSSSTSHTHTPKQDLSEADKKLQQRERNKQAASRFRIRQQYKTESLQQENLWLKTERERLQRENHHLRDENRRLQQQQQQYGGAYNASYTQRIL
ncbi:hypothetical protein E3P99_03036 [Wallemia hederae]|uniref:BZIP domain-containing protein n=1 Tax=Wallemia hederae TaxID=1540922 RepID=A0A4T0FH64_9BASI|nr:hypothetical protein E3P99_03036 [Wallemia hederae]